MGVQESLTATLKGRNKLSKTLRSVADKADDVSESMTDAAESATVLSGALEGVEDQSEDAEDEVSQLERSVNSLNRSFESGILAAGGYATALEAIDDADIDVDTFSQGRLPVAPQSASRASDGLPRQGHVEVEADVDRSSFATARAMTESLPDKHTVEVDTDEKHDLTSLRRSFASIRNLSLPSSSTDAIDEDLDNTTEKTHKLHSALSVLPGLLATIQSIDIGEDLFPDRDGRDGTIMPNLPDWGDLGLTDRPPPEVDVPVDLRPSRIDLSKHIPDSVATRVEFDRDRIPDIRSVVPESVTSRVRMVRDRDIDLRSLVPESLTTRVEFDHDRRAISRLRHKVSESIRVPIEFVRGATPDAPSFGGGGEGDAFDVHLGSVIPDMPDIDMPRLSRITPSLDGISKSGRTAADTLKNVGSGMMSVLGLTEQAMGLSRIASSLGKIGGSGGAVTVLGAIGGALASWAVIGTVLGAITALIAAIGGLVTAIVGLGAATAGLLGMGLLKRGEQFARTSEDIEGTMEGIQAYVKSLQPAVEKAIEPLRSLPTGNFLEGFISGGIGALSDFATMTKRLFPDISGMFDRLGNVWSAEQPEFFAELEETIRAFLPMLEGFLGWFIKSAPSALSVMRSMGTKLLPKLARMFGAIGENIGPFIPAGAALLSILIDLTTAFFEVMAPISKMMGMSIGPLLMALAWGMDKLATGIKMVSDPLTELMSTMQRWVNALYSAVFDLDGRRFGAILQNLVIGLLETLTNAFITGINGLYQLVLSRIKQIPGAKQAIGAMNAASKAQGKGKAVPDKLVKDPVSFRSLKADLNPNRPGKQTQPGNGPGRAQGPNPQPYAGGGGDKIVNNFNGDTVSPSEMEKRVRDAMQKSERYERRTNSGHP